MSFKKFPTNVKTLATRKTYFVILQSYKQFLQLSHFFSKLEIYLNRVRTRWLWTAGLKGGRFNPSFSERDKKQMIDLREISTNWFKIQLCSSIRLSRLRARIYRINRTVMRAGRSVLCSHTNGARWPSSRPLSRNVTVLQVGCPWKICGREPCTQKHPSDRMKASNGRDVGNSKGPSNGNTSFKQGTPTG